MRALDLALQMRLVENTQDFLVFFPERGVGRYDGAAHVGAGYDGRCGAARGFVVVVEAHYDFGVAVVEGDSVDFYEDFVWACDWKRGGGLGEVGETILGGDPLLDLRRGRHVDSDVFEPVRN